jgi:hypothetical protein
MISRSEVERVGLMEAYSKSRRWSSGLDEETERWLDWAHWKLNPIEEISVLGEGFGTRVPGLEGTAVGTAGEEMVQ